MKPDISTLTDEEKTALLDQLLESISPSKRNCYSELEQLALAKKEWQGFGEKGDSMPLDKV